MIELYEKKLIHNEFMGVVKLNAIEFTDDKPHTAWYRLRPRKTDSSVKGEIFVTIHFRVRKNKLVRNNYLGQLQTASFTQRN